MKSVKLTKNSDERKSVKKTKIEDKNQSLVFTFADFRHSSIVLKNRFNNHYDNQDEYARKMSVMLGKALPLLSKESQDIFVDNAKMNALHMHKIKNKADILTDILKAYSFSDQSIENMLEGESIYQLEMPYENGATRIVFQKIGNTISFLFMDPNHHIYLDPQKSAESGSLFYEWCPIYEEGQCPRMDYLGTCFAFEFLDQ